MPCELTVNVNMDRGAHAFRRSLLVLVRTTPVNQVRFRDRVIEEHIRQHRVRVKPVRARVDVQDLVHSEFDGVVQQGPAALWIVPNALISGCLVKPHALRRFDNSPIRVMPVFA